MTKAALDMTTQASKGQGITSVVSTQDMAMARGCCLGTCIQKDQSSALQVLLNSTNMSTR